MATKYAVAHESPNGPGDSRPTALRIIQDEHLEGNLADKVILITGCSSGLGIATARALAKTGAKLFVTARNPQKAKVALGNLLESDRIQLLALDLNSLASVRASASEFLAQSHQKLNILITNAGVMATPEGKTADGFESQFGINHLAHFLLLQLLKPALLSSSTPTSPSRVVFVSSVAHRISTVHMDNISLAGEYEPWIAYGQSKTAVIWTANEVQRRYGSKGLLAFSLHPGGITTGLQQHVPDEVQQNWGADRSFALRWKSVEQGAATTVWAAVAKALEDRGGNYLDDCQIAGPHDPETGLMGAGYAPWAYDEVNAAKLWNISMKMVGLDGEN
ncbi:hypothetical protein N7508_009721 [Penicillium antarcticum]|uniref:uncharacterized protein n=1 Tax=Penicillium antarcticum TaxID=416450 RepID=UPI002389727C|nr:uncharacterized protein N7508_009721 [Penicillium antarcticum]KAJ5294900.1 hypothetical protein N7508_009721 [Penicillium antarcticum]